MKKKSKNNDTNNFKYRHFNIPSTLDLTLWDNTKFTTENTAYSTLQLKDDNGNFYSVDILSSIKENSITHFIKNTDTLLLTIEDNMLNP